MKKILFVLLLLLAGCAAQVSEHGAQHVPSKAMKVHADKDLLTLHDFNLTFIRPQAETGKSTPLTFSLMKNGKAIELTPLHEKLMHLIIVRKDLKYFSHLHPEEKEPGTFTATQTFVASGEYALWIEFSNGTLEHTISYRLNVAGNITGKEEDTLGDVQVDFTSPEMRQDEKTELTFKISQDGKPAKITEPYLGAGGHLIVIHETLEEFDHLHDENLGNTQLSFEITPEIPGNYAAWIEFKKDGSTRIKKVEFSVGKND